MSSGRTPPFPPAESRTPRGVNTATEWHRQRKSARVEKGVREVACGIGRVGWVWRGGQSYRGLQSPGTPSNVEELDVVLENSSSLGLEVGVENRDLRQRAGSQSGNARGTDLSVLQHFVCAMPTLLATVPPRFKHHLTFCLRARATVRCVWMQMGGGAMCTLQGARRTGTFERPEADQVRSAGVPAHRARPGPRSPSRAAISPSSEGLSGPHHADKTNFCGCGRSVAPGGVGCESIVSERDRLQPSFLMHHND